MCCLLFLHWYPHVKCLYFPDFRYWDFVGFAARVVLVGLYFRPHQDHRDYEEKSVNMIFYDKNER